MDPMSRDDFKRAFEDCAIVGATSFTAHPHPLELDDTAVQQEFQERFGTAAEIGSRAVDVAALFAITQSCVQG